MLCLNSVHPRIATGKFFRLDGVRIEQLVHELAQRAPWNTSDRLALRLDTDFTFIGNEQFVQGRRVKGRSTPIDLQEIADLMYDGNRFVRCQVHTG